MDHDQDLGGAPALPVSRRTLIGGLGLSLVLAVGGLGLAGEAEAKKKKKGKKKRKRNKKKGGNANGMSSQPEIDGEESAFLTLINNYRTGNGRAPLSINAQLSAAAAAHSLDMGLHNYFDHINKQGKDPADRAEAAGYVNWIAVGENIAAGNNQDTAAKAFDMWRNSPPHNENMLDREFLEIGIGRLQVPGSKYSWYWTTVFGTSA